MKNFIAALFLLAANVGYAQTWTKIDSLYGPLPKGVHVYKSVDPLDSQPNTMYYVELPLKNKNLRFATDTTLNRRLTPSQFFEKNGEPLLVVNTSFFTFDTHKNLNVVIKDGKVVSYNTHNIRKKDGSGYVHPFFGALGIFKNRTADVAWVYSDTLKRHAYASQTVVPAYTDDNNYVTTATTSGFRKWKVQTAVSGGPVLLQNGKVEITNDEELRFSGAAVDDRHPRTAMGYTGDGRLIVFVCEGRSPQAAGLSLTQMAGVMQKLGCVEALNLDGGGSTCLLLNGKEVNTPSSNGVQRALPSVFLVKEK